MKQDNARIRESFGFYNTNKNLFDSSEYWFEDVRFPEEAIEQKKAQILNEGYDEEDVEHMAHDRLMDDLGYFTVYFEPEHENVEVALRVGLVPFYFKDDFYLALGGYGMDLSPMLDAYQALLTGTLPRDSQLFKQEDYFEHVVGVDITKEVKEKVAKKQMVTD